MRGDQLIAVSYGKGLKVNIAEYGCCGKAKIVVIGQTEVTREKELLVV